MSSTYQVDISVWVNVNTDNRPDLRKAVLTAVVKGLSECSVVVGIKDVEIGQVERIGTNEVRQ